MIGCLLTTVNLNLNKSTGFSEEKKQLYKDEAKRINHRRIATFPTPLGPKNVSDLITKMAKACVDHSHLEVVIISLNSYVRIEKLGKNDFIAPAELGLVRFSIQRGIIESKHLVFNRIEIPPGIVCWLLTPFGVITIFF